MTPLMAGVPGAGLVPGMDPGIGPGLAMNTPLSLSHSACALLPESRPLLVAGFLDDAGGCVVAAGILLAQWVVAVVLEFARGVGIADAHARVEVAVGVERWSAHQVIGRGVIAGAGGPGCGGWRGPEVDAIEHVGHMNVPQAGSMDHGQGQCAMVAAT